VTGYHLAFWVAAALVGVAVAIAAFVLQPVAAAAGGSVAGELDVDAPQPAVL
jgi:hypothetical protein